MNIPVSDPFRAAADPALPTLAAALDPLQAKKEFKRRLPVLSGRNGKLRLQAIRVTRHKPGRRCVVEYDVLLESPGAASQLLTLVGKARARRFGNESVRLLEQIWQAGFDDQSADGVSVPQPVGVIPRFQMWFQRKVPGEPAANVMAGPDGLALASRVAQAIYKLHRAGIPTERSHGMEDELRILRDCLTKAAQLRPELAARLERLRAACQRLGDATPASGACGVHRDFYPAQVLVDGARLFLLDFDLYCLGDPALDPGNFIGHLIEQAVREFGDESALAAQAAALEERFAALCGEQHRAALRAYTTLTVARHVYLSTQFPERASCTERLLESCERRLGLS